MVQRLKSASGRPPLYPWLEWFQRRKILLRRGTHYHCTSLSMGQQIRNAAVRAGLKVRVTEVDTGLLVEIRNEKTHANHRKD